MKKIALLFTLAILGAFCIPKQLSWVAIGDSITYLNDHGDETGHRVTKGYLTRVCEKISGLHYINQGHNGWTAGGIAQEIDQLGIPTADIYSVFLGTNDWWSGRPAGSLADYQHNNGDRTVSGAFRIIIDKIRSLNKDARIIFITPLQRGDFVALMDMKNNAYGSYRNKNGQSLEQVVSAIQAIAQSEHFGLVDLYHTESLSLYHLVKYKRLRDPSTGVYTNYPYPAFVDIPFDPLHDEYPYPTGAIDQTYDGLHPSDKGNEIIAELLSNKIQESK